MYVILATGLLLWLIYGLLLRNPPMIIANGLTFIFSMIVLVLKIRHG
jgi:MtN3 and saliva related transmembrane protein